MPYVFAEFGTVACGPGMGGNCPPTCPPGYVYSPMPGTGGLVFSCDSPSPDTQGNCPSGFSLRVSETRSGTFKTCRSVQPPACLPGTTLHNDGDRCISVIQEPRNQADCPAGTFFTPRGGTRTLSRPARCAASPSIIPGLPFPGLPGFTQPLTPPVVRPKSLPCPATGNCPPEFQYRQAGSCRAPDGSNLTHTCSCQNFRLPLEAARLIQPCTQQQLTQGKYAGSTPAGTAGCQTGYVLEAGQCTKPVVALPLEIKTAGITSWASTNWKWLAALAVIGAVGYGWAKRKPVEE